MPLPDDLLSPIDASNPGGVSVRYEPVFDEIKEARREEDDVPQGDWEHDRKTADPAKVIKLATEVLAKQSKDLQVAAWLTEALLLREGFGGLRNGLGVMRGLVENFWDHLYPEMEDEEDLELRAAPLSWVGLYLEIPVKRVALNAAGHDFFQLKEARAMGYEEDAKEEAQQEARQQFIAAGKPTMEAVDESFDQTPKAWYKQLLADIDGSLAELKALDALGNERFGREAPSYAKLRDALGEVRRSGQQLLDKKLETDPDPVEETIDMGDGGDLAPGDAATSLPVEPTSAKDAASRVAAAARFFQREDPKNPSSYLMLRGFRWGELRALGGGIDPKMLAAPPTPVRTRLKGLLLDQKWAELLAAAEAVMATAHGRGWLDLQRYVLTACENLGPEFDPVSKSIRGALAALLHDLPEITQETLMDDTPTANRETMQWLREHVPAEAFTDAQLPAPGQVEAAQEPDVAARPAAAPGRSVLDRAMVYVRSGNPQKGIELLMQEAEKVTSPRERFLRKTEAATLMVDAGLEAVALPTLRQLVDQIEKHQLEGWEAGEVIARPMALLYRALRRVEGESETTQGLYQRIAQLDPMLAIAAAKEPPPSPTPTADHGETDG
jgi:type VI secretion system protein ImpA